MHSTIAALAAANVGVELKDVNSRLEKFASRWSALKPREMKSWHRAEVEAVFASLAEWTVQLDGIRATAAAMAATCDSFDLPPPVFTGLAVLEADFDSTKASWELYRTYDDERSTLAGQDWLGFRARIFDLQDFSTKWLDAVRGKGKDVVCARIFEEADGVRKAFNALKFARGEPFKEEHWSAVFKKLGMPKGVRLDTLTVGHFLDALDALAANLQFLKDLQARSVFPRRVCACRRRAAV
jgi:dynein heavy chain 2